MTKVSLVIPVYNYASKISQTIDTIQDHCKSKDGWEIIFVDDGSTDNTVDIIETKIKNQRMRILKQPSNQGKGAAVRRGLMESKGLYRVFTDCDLAYDLKQVDKVVAALENGADVAYADRTHPLSNCIVESGAESYQSKRNIMSYVLRKMIRGAGVKNVGDTQAGLKGFKGDVAHIIPLSKINGFPFDIELLVIAQVNKLKLESVPVEYHIEDAPSTVVPQKVVVDFLKSIAKIRSNKLRGLYRAKDTR